MSVSGINNRLGNSYQAKTLDNNQLKTIKNDNTLTDNILNLSGDSSQIASEIMSQDINSIKAININGKLVSLNKDQVTKLVSELKEKCLNPDNSLKENFKFANFEKSTGISVVESDLDVKTLESTDKSTGATGKLLSDLNTHQLFDINVDKSNGNIKNQHINKASEIGSAIGKIDKQIESLKGQVESLKSTSADPKTINDLESQIKVLSGSKDVLQTNKEIHSLLGQINNPLTATSVAPPTNPAIIKKLETLNNKLELQTQDLKTVSDQAKGSIDDKGLNTNVSKLIKGAEKSQSMTKDAIGLCNNQAFMNSLNMMGKHQSLPLTLVQYKEYMPLAESHRRAGKGETADASGFINACANDVTYDVQGSANIKNMSDKIIKGEYKSPEEVKNAVEKMFQTNSGKFFIAKDKVDKVVGLYTKLYTAVDLKQDVTALKGKVNSQTKELVEDQISQAQVTHKKLTQESAISLKGTGFGPRALTASQDINTKTTEAIKSAEPQIKELNNDLQKVIKDEYNQMTQTGKGMGQFLDKYLGFDSKVHLEVVGYLGAEAKVLGAGADGKVGIGFGATVEKTFGAAYTYTAHFDFKFNSEFEAKFGSLFSSKLGYEYNKVLAGVGFNKAGEIEALMSKFADSITAFKAGDDKKSESLLNDALDELSQRTYESSKHTGKAEMKLGDPDHGTGLSVNAEISSQRTTLKAPNGKEFNILDETKTYEANYNGYKMMVKDETSTTVDGRGSNVPVKANEDTPYPILGRHLVEVKIPMKAIKEAVTTGKMPDCKKLAHAMILASPALQECGIDMLTESINKYMSNLVTSPLYANLGPIIGAYGTNMELPDAHHGGGHDHSGPVHAHADLTLGLDMVDDPETGKRKLKFELGVHGEVGVDSGKVAVLGKAAGGDHHQTGAQAYVQVKGKFEVAAVGVMGYTKLGNIPGADAYKAPKINDVAASIIKKYDADKNGSINVIKESLTKEFYSKTSVTGTKISRGEAFIKADTNKDGKVDKKELATFIEKSGGIEAFEEKYAEKAKEIERP